MSTQQSPASLSAADHARQSAFFRTFNIGVPGVMFCTKSGAFKASYVGAEGKPEKLGLFDTLDDAVTAISRTYETIAEVA